MKTIEVKVYNFSELSNEAKQKAIENKRELMYNDDLHHLIDDCYLFEPNHLQLCSIFPDYEKLEKPIIGNNRKVYFGLDRYRHLDASEGIVINYPKHFLTWLGIPENLQNKINWNIESSNSEYGDTILTFETDYYDNELTDHENEILENASSKFSDHMDTVLKRITENYEYYFSDENITNGLEDFYIFRENGEIFY